MPTHPPYLILVTDRHRVHGGDLVRAVGDAVAGGVRMVILREKDLPAGEMLALAQRLREVTLGRALLMVNDRVDVAAACGADGAHLGEAGLPVAAAMQVAPDPQGFLVGRSVHSVAGAEDAMAEGADYVLAGSIFATGSHPGATPAGTALLERIAAEGIAPLYAIGGITAENAGACLHAGAQGVAVISAILGDPDPEAAARRLVEAMRRHR